MLSWELLAKNFLPRTSYCSLIRSSLKLFVRGAENVITSWRECWAENQLPTVIRTQGIYQGVARNKGTYHSRHVWFRYCAPAGAPRYWLTRIARIWSSMGWEQRRKAEGSEREWERESGLASWYSLQTMPKVWILNPGPIRTCSNPAKRQQTPDCRSNRVPPCRPRPTWTAFHFGANESVEKPNKWDENMV